MAKRFAHAISMHYQDFEHAYVYWIWLRGSASYVIPVMLIITLKRISNGPEDICFPWQWILGHSLIHLQV